MASSSSSHQQNPELKAFSGIKPAGIRRKISESSRLFDVFINHRGPDVKQTLATQLYNSLEQLGIRTFLDSKEKELGNSFPSTIETAIRSAKVHIAIFSKGYAESPWCLDELLLMLETKAKIIPIFYQVMPSDLRHIESGVYAGAFIKYEKKGRYVEKLGEWKEALQSLSFIAGEEFQSDCKNIVATVQKELERKRYLHVATHPVGLNNLVKDFEMRCLEELAQDFENQCGLKEGKHSAKVVGIFGMGGSGKTTLSKELFNRKILSYSRASFLFDVREASVRNQLHSLQLKLLKDLFQNHDLRFTSPEEGTSYLKDSFQRSPHLSFLIVVDDIDYVEQLNALAVMDILNNIGDSLVIVTTRDVGVLITAGITVGYNLRGMDRNYGRELFCWHAFGQPHPSSGYEKLVDSFVDVCGGLPLSLQVLGRHVHGRNKDYWNLELVKVRKTLPRDIKNRLRISFHALDDEEKQVFMDIACFFIGEAKSIAERLLKGSGWNAQHALATLKNKCLVEEFKLRSRKGEVTIGLRMHDHLRDLGREMALELSPPHRLWRPQDLKVLESMGFKLILAKTNIRCYHSIFDKSLGSQVTFFVGQPRTWLETSASLLWLQLEGNSGEQPCIPSWIPLQNLQRLTIKGGQLKTLWENPVQAPSQLKELQICETSLIEFPDLLGVSKDSLENRGKSSSVKTPKTGLEKLEIGGEKFVSKILISGIHYHSLKSIKLHGMENLKELNLIRVKTLNCLDIKNCAKLKRLIGTSDLTNLVLLNINQCPDLEFEDLRLMGMKCLEGITFDRNVKLKYFELGDCQNLKSIDFGCEELVELTIRGCPELVELPAFLGPRSLERIIFDGCGKLECLELNGCQMLRSVSGNFDLKALYIYDCPELEVFPSLARPSCLRQIVIDSCDKLQNISGIDDLRGLRLMRLIYWNNAVIRDRIHKLKSVPSVGMDMIGRAVDGAESSFNEYLFSDVHIDLNAIIEIGSHETFLKWSELSAVIGCFLVVIDTSISEEGINKLLPLYGPKARQGEWIITMVACDISRYYYLRAIEGKYLWEIVKSGYEELDDWNALTTNERTTKKEARKNNAQDLFHIQIAHDKRLFPRILGVTIAKDAWKTLQEAYQGSAQVKVVKV
ncbi:disease resistance protein Roq1-like [Cryptomeria japonica]|uniref:disease resistance protein Roq1-like n=1 Tax=Cryptomeria japonica TaxID=3369 RepID=UPI0027DA5E32|nr:disease resistance protein Roq1-like [Cryptomeria japonica]